MGMSLAGTAVSSRKERWLRMWARAQHELLFITWGVMETALLLPISLALMPWARYWQRGQVLLWLLLLLFFAFNLTRLLAALQLPGDQQRNLMAVALLLTIFLSLRTLVHEPTSLFDFSWIGRFVQDVGEAGNSRWTQDISLFAVIVIVWYRGIRLAGREFDINKIGLWLRVGSLLLAPLIIWLGSVRLQWDVTPYLLLYFLAALTAVSLIRAEQVEQERSIRSASLHPRWLAAIFLASLLTILLGGFLAILISGDAAPAVLGWLAPLVISLEYTVSIALSTLLFVALPGLVTLDTAVLALSNLLSSFILWVQQTTLLLQKIAAKLVEAQPLPEAITGDPAAASEPIPFLTRALELGDLGSVSNILWLLLMIAVVLIVALTVSGRFRQTTLADRVSGRLGSSESGERPNLAQRVLQRLGFLRDWRKAASIRRVYRHMLRAAAASGYPRLETETPFEFLRTLRQAWPQHPSETALITNAYVNIRYGELPETEAELNAIVQAWRTLETHPPETAAADPHAPNANQ